MSNNTVVLPSARVEGRYKLETFKMANDEAGELYEVPNSRKVAADWFENIITNQGLNKLGTTPLALAADYCHVGTGTTAELATDTSMETFVAATQGTISAASVAQTSTPPYYISYARTKRFGEGVAQGNLSEVGMAWTGSGSTVFSRALIVDGGGSPTTVTVLSDEYLDVTYEYRVYPPASDSTGTITLNSVSYDYIARPSEIDLAASNGWNIPNQHGVETDINYQKAYTGNIGATALLSPSGTAASATSVANGSYSNESLEGEGVVTWGLTEGNIGGIRSVRLQIGWTMFQIQFDATVGGATIPKDATNILTLTLKHSWARATI